MSDRREIQIFAHWQGMSEPKLVGSLLVVQAKGHQAYGFRYNPAWISSAGQLLLDPEIGWYSGTQYSQTKENFGVILDSMPDSWGRTLMKRKALFEAKASGKPVRALQDTDYLLGVHDLCRMGALRFKIDAAGAFLDDDPEWPIPPLTSMRELQYAAQLFETNADTEEAGKWLNMLMAPGSSLGGARPKANLMDEQGQPWIAKFPSKNDLTDVAAWEYLAYRLALFAGIDMAECKLENVSGPYRTFFTKRFDRMLSERIHFASAMTMTGYNETMIRDKKPSYLEIAEFIQFAGSRSDDDLKQLWRRIVFNIMISNTDDHLRNHGFILCPEGWRLSPAFDINPSTDKNGLALNIDLDNNSLDLELVKSVGVYFRLNDADMNTIIDEVRSSVSQWQKVANDIGIQRNEQIQMASAFKV